MSIYYKNIRNRKEVTITAQEYNQQIAKSRIFEQDFFGNSELKVELLSAEELGNGTVLYNAKYSDIEVEFYILWGPLKNSGINGNERKRIQVLPRTTLVKEVPYFAIGAYNTLDSNIYVALLGGTSHFIRNAQNGRTYSSLWFDYDQICRTYHSNSPITWHDNSTNRYFFGCRSTQIEELHNALKNVIAKRSSEENIDDIHETENDIPFVEFFGEIAENSATSELPRNPLYREIALKRENYTCEICGTQKTFVDNNNDEYFEGHHLIMYNPRVQRRFRFNLDHPSNIICLCPNCHREIHHSPEERIRALVIKLFTKHNDLLRNYSINNLEEIITDYLTVQQ